MAVLLLMPSRDTSDLAAALARLEPGLDVRVWPKVGDAAAIEVAVCWSHPPGSLLDLPRLRAILSYGAGVDHLLGDPRLPEGVPIARFVDPGLARDMAEYVLTAVLAHRRGIPRYLEQQRTRTWDPHPYRPAGTALVLGLGRMGLAAARLLAAVGLEVRGWSRTPHEHEGLTCFTSEDGLAQGLAGADHVICLLPLTPATEGMLGRSLLARMAPGSQLVNAGRGRHLDEQALLEALDAGRPAAAWLDVFADEPLPGDHPFWTHPAITITPHVASLTDPAAVAAQVVECLHRVRSGELPGNLVDPVQGY